jgi:hypothetical protein
LDRLEQLAQHQLGFLETIQLDRAIQELCLEPAPGYLPVRLAVLAYRYDGSGYLQIETRIAGRIQALKQFSLSESHRLK